MYAHDWVMFCSRPLDNSTEGFQNWEFMTAHSWGEQAAGEWTLKIKDTPSQKRDSAELGLFFLFVASLHCETYLHWTSRGGSWNTAPASGDKPVFLSLCCFTGILKKWSLVIYGTAEQPYHMRHRRVRSAEPSRDSDLTEGYDGESRPNSGFSEGNVMSFVI